MTHLSEKRHSFGIIENQSWHSDGEAEVALSFLKLQALWVHPGPGGCRLLRASDKRLRRLLDVEVAGG
jgi:hypothetical protein